MVWEGQVCPIVDQFSKNRNENNDAFRSTGFGRDIRPAQRPSSLITAFYVHCPKDVSRLLSKIICAREAAYYPLPGKTSVELRKATAVCGIVVMLQGRAQDSMAVTRDSGGPLAD